MHFLSPYWKGHQFLFPFCNHPFYLSIQNGNRLSRIRIIQFIQNALAMLHYLLQRAAHRIGIGIISLIP